MSAAPAAPQSLREAFGAGRVFWCNTNRGGPQAEPNHLELQMYARGVAAAWAPFDYPGHMLQVRRGDFILAYARQLGVIGVGVALDGGRVEVLGPDHPDRIREYQYGEHEQEWRIPVLWLDWDAADPCPVPSPLQGTFREVTHLPDRVEPARAHFVRRENASARPT